MQRTPRVRPAAPLATKDGLDFDAAPNRFTPDLQKKLQRDLRRVLEELDAIGLPLVAVHVDAALCALMNGKTQWP